MLVVTVKQKGSHIKITYNLANHLGF